MAGISLKGLTKRFGTTVAVDRVDLDIEQGEFVSLLGPSGCGKTTTLRLLAGFLGPDEGAIVAGTVPLSSPGRVVPPERRNMSMIFQSYAIWPHMTVLENVAYGLRLRRLPRAEVLQRTRRMLRVVRLEDLEDRYPAQLSGGQQQRVALARALAVEPQILLLDEPLSNLDATLREEMRFEIRRLHDEFGITTVYVTHDQGEAMVTSDRIVVMNVGRIIQVGTPEEVYERPATAFVAGFIGKTNIVEGVLTPQGDVETAAGRWRVGKPQGPAPQAGEKVRLAFRPHHAVLRAQPPGTGGQAAVNWFPAVVERATYLGDARDYLVSLGDRNEQLRVVTEPGIRFSVGSRVYVVVESSRCILVA